MKNKLVFAGLLIAVLAIGFSVVGCTSMGGSSTPSDGRQKLPFSWLKYDEEGWIQASRTSFDSSDYLIPLKNDGANAPDVFEMDIKKVAGSPDKAIYMIFGGSSASTQKWYRVCISPTGSFDVSKRQYGGGSPTAFTEWAASEYINKGLGAVNNIKVVRSGTQHTVFLNGNQVAQFTDNELKGDYIGIALQKQNETTPVDVRFLIK